MALELSIKSNFFIENYKRKTDKRRVEMSILVIFSVLNFYLWNGRFNQRILLTKFIFFNSRSMPTEFKITILFFLDFLSI